MIVFFSGISTTAKATVTIDIDNVANKVNGVGVDNVVGGEEVEEEEDEEDPLLNINEV